MNTKGTKNMKLMSKNKIKTRNKKILPLKNKVS